MTSKQPSHIAVVHQGDNKSKARVDVYDAHGRARTFQLDKNHGNLKNGNKIQLCFSTHNSGHGIDELLTPCFDEDGLHGTPNEGCFCGVDEPHLHAHVYDPKTCGNDDSPSCQKKHGHKLPDIAVLSSLTLYPINDDEFDKSCACCGPEDAKNETVRPVTSSPGDDADCKNIASIPVSVGLPAACNSRQIGDIMDRLKGNERESGFQIKVLCCRSVDFSFWYCLHCAQRINIYSILFVCHNLHGFIVFNVNYCYSTKIMWIIWCTIPRLEICTLSIPAKIVTVLIWYVQQRSYGDA